MNIIFLSIVCLVHLTLAEPPVGDGYPAARSSAHHHHSHDDHHGHADHESLPQEYGPPRNAISTQYGVPNARASHNAPKAKSSSYYRGQKHTPATVRVSFNQRFSSAASRAARGHNPLLNGESQGYDTPNTRSGVSQQYGPPEAKSLSLEYGEPSTRSLSTEYGAPRPSEEYRVPVARNTLHSSNTHSQNSLSSEYTAPKSANSQSGYSAARSNEEGYEASNSYTDSEQTYETSKSLSSTYGTPSEKPSTSYGVPSTRNAPNEKELSEVYGAPNARSSSQEYGVPSSRSNVKANAVASSYSSAGASSATHPAAREAPSQQYGVPNQGYENSRARALEELLNQEPANYDFAYQIEDQESGSDFGHAETRQDNRVEGSYFVVLPDGTKQTVEYEADERGFKPRISVESAAGGYDDNAQDLARSQGPY